MALHVLFLLSGVTGLIYEVAWTRAFAFVFGNTTYAVSAVLAAFMAGLALGNWFFGRRVDRRPGDELGLYAVLEVGIAVSAVAVIPVLDRLDGLYGLLFRAAPHSLWLLTACRGLLAFLLLLAPSFLMGGTLPVLSRYVIRGRRDLAGGVGALYGLNTAGAAAGCLVTGFLLVEHLGVRGSVAAAAALNLLLAAAFLVLRAAHRRRAPGDAPDPETAAPKDGPARTSGLLLLGIAAASGFAALGCEVLWTRLLVFKLKTTTYAFSVMLTTFLTGLGLGGLLLSAWERTRGGRGDSAWHRLSGLQAGIGLSALASIFVIGGLEGVDVAADGSWGARTLRQLGLSAAVMLPPTLMMGMSLPLLARLAAPGRGVGEAVGRVYAANTAGAVLGSLISGFLLAPWLGTQYSLVLLAGVNLCLAAAVLGAAPAAVRSRAPAWRRSLLGAWAAAGAGLLVLPPDLLLRLYNAGEREVDSRARILHAREGAGGITTVHQLPGGDRVISTGSINVAGTTLTLRTTQMLQAHIPALLHPGPRRVLQIGFGSGETAHILSGYPGCSLDVAEISRSVLDEADGFFRDINRGVLRHPSVTPFVTDGASFLRLARSRYDLILNDSIWPYYAGNSGLYTREHFAAGRDRLRPGGLMTSWLPLDMRLQSFLTILRTFHSVFPHFTIWAANTHYTKHALLVGSLEPLRIDAADFLDRFADRAAAGLAPAHLGDPVLLLDCFLTDETGLGAELAGAPLHTVDRPVLEFAPSKPSLHAQLAVYELLFRERRPVTGYLEGLDPVGDRDLLEEIERTRRASTLVVEAILRRERRQPGWRTHLQQALDLRPDHPGLRVLLQRTGRLAQVEETALEGRTYRELTGLADRQAKAGLHARAARVLRRAIRLHPDRPAAHQELGLVLAAAGDLDGAARALERALELAPGAAASHLGLGNVRRRQGGREAAAAHYRQALAAEPGLAEAHYSLGTLLAEQGRRTEALEAQREALRLRPGYVRAHIAAGVLLDGEGRLEEAVSHFREAVRLSPRDPAACNNLVVALAAAGLGEEAREQLAAARGRGVDMAVAARVLGAREVLAPGAAPGAP